MAEKKNIIITAGDPFGIGPEVLIKALSVFAPQKAVAITVIGEEASLKKAGWRDSFGVLIPVKSAYKKPSSPKPSKYGGDISFKALKKAVDIMLAGKGDALVTAPISKEAWAMCGIKFTGHTEVLNQYAAKEGALMMFNSGKINCALVTEHYAVVDLKKALTAGRIIKAAKIFYSVLGKDAEIGFSALNPHCGDGGKIGGEEKEIIAPALAKLNKEGFLAQGPYPIDSLWPKHAKGVFDGIVCMYHDQALLGLKLAAKEPVVHITAGLKFLRVSPTHGTAFDIAGQNKADYKSMLAAINYAAAKISK